jgi:hypothetical protein
MNSMNDIPCRGKKEGVLQTRLVAARQKRKSARDRDPACLPVTGGECIDATFLRPYKRRHRAFDK